MLRCLFCDYTGELQGLCDHSAVCSRHPLQAELTALRKRRDALAAHCERLRAALVTVARELDTIADGKQDEAKNEATSAEARAWEDARRHVVGITEPALATTPAQSLALIQRAAKVEALEALAVKYDVPDSLFRDVALAERLVNLADLRTAARCVAAMAEEIEGNRLGGSMRDWP